MNWEEKDEFAPGDICHVEKDAFWIRCKMGALRVTCMQMEGKKRMSTKDFLLGNDLAEGDSLGT